MAGLSIMALGPYQFQAMGFSFNGRSRSQRTPWATIQVAGGRDRVQWTGGESITETISGVIFEEFGGQNSLEGLKQAARDGTPLTLVDFSAGLSNIFGMYVLEEITEELSHFSATGAPLKTSYAIKVRLFEGPAADLTSIPVLSLFT